MDQLTQDQVDLVKAGAFATYADAGIPQEQWEQKFASHVQHAAQVERFNAVASIVKAAAEEVKSASLRR